MFIISLYIAQDNCCLNLCYIEIKRNDNIKSMKFSRPQIPVNQFSLFCRFHLPFSDKVGFL